MDALLNALDFEYIESVLVANGNPGGKSAFTKWVPRRHRDGHQFRTVYSHEVVFDIGDDGDWTKCRNNTIALWGRLEREGHEAGIDYWPCLSGGRGTHTHVFVGRPEWREAFACSITRSYAGNPGIRVDPCTIDPSPGARMVREFGSGKNGKRKTLWPWRYDLLPATLEKAYEMAGPVRIPARARNVGLPIGALQIEIGATFGGLCGRFRECFTDWPCDKCPSMK